jgi:predicted TIM-barrel fold metal-dependent hydrolase
MDLQAPARIGRPNFRQKRDPQVGLSRREFCGALLAMTLASGCKHSTAIHSAQHDEAIIDIHQHVGYSGRPNEALLAHQRVMGVTQTVLLPAGTPTKTPATHDGFSNGLQARCAGNQACLEFAKAHPGRYYFGANEVPDLPMATREIEKYLRCGGRIIAEQKFGMECDALEMQRIYALAAEYRVPVLMHWQHEMYNYGFERFHKMLDRYPRTNFIGHAQTWWAHIDSKCDPSVLYPKGRVTPGGLTDRYISDYPNMYGDLSAGSGLGAITRDEDFTRDFFQRHQDKLLFGSDCSDWRGEGPACQGAQTLAAVRKMAPNRLIERKLLCGNAVKLFRL